MTCAAIITAGGIGRRMGGKIPKQYLNLEGIPILARTIAAFQAHPIIDQIVVTVPAGEEDFCRTSIVEPYQLGKVKHIVIGGATRQESVYNGLRQLGECDIVAIHDGVRPLVSAQVIAETVDAARDVGAAVACVAVRETVKRKAGSHLETIPRTDLWLAHTPQTFRTSLITEAHEKAAADGFDGTDDAVLVERLGLPVEIVEDSSDNIKITTPADLERAELLLKQMELTDPNRACKAYNGRTQRR